MMCSVRAAIAAMVLCALTTPAVAQEGVFLTEEQAPHAVFPDATKIERHQITASDALRARLKADLGGAPMSIWEASYVFFDVWRDEAHAGRAFLVEEIGKHRPITFVVGVRDDGHVQDVAVVAYREAYGGEIRHKRFLVQYRDKKATDSLQPYQDITNIAGATLSVEAAGRAVKKALALARETDTGSASAQ